MCQEITEPSAPEVSQEPVSAAAANALLQIYSRKVMDRADETNNPRDIFKGVVLGNMIGSVDGGVLSIIGSMHGFGQETYDAIVAEIVSDLREMGMPEKYLEVADGPHPNYA